MKKCSVYFMLLFFLLPSVFLNADKSRILDTVTGVDEYGNVEYIRTPRPKIVLSNKELYHYEYLEIMLFNMHELDPSLFHAHVVRDGRVYPSAGIEYDIPFIRDDSVLRAVYLPDWNEREGEFEIEIYYGGRRLKTDGRLAFVIKRRPIPPIEEGISIVDLELNKSIRDMRLFDPWGRKTDYRAVLEWARFMDADMIWILSGETTSFKRRNTGTSPWDSGPLENLRLIKKIASQYSVDVGAYIMSFYVPGTNGIPDRYKPGIGYNSKTDTLYYSKHISLSCDRRIQDIIDLAREFQEDPDIGYIGFDFIRTGRADGYELAPQVIRDTNIRTPADWEDYSTTEKINWFARKIEVERDSLILEKWRWWRAHRVAEIIRQIMEEADISKPVWVYTLGWNHGKEHGQDPVMFFDAGVTYDAVMLYEASNSQFARLLGHWNDYITRGQGNILIGSCVDYTLLDSDYLDPPEEFFRRNIEGYRNIMRNGLAKGIFFHDIARAFWGRKGKYSIRDYAIAHLSSVYRLKKDLRSLELLIDVRVDGNEIDQIDGVIQFKNNSTHHIENIQVELLSPKSEDTYIVYKQDIFDEPLGERIIPGNTSFLHIMTPQKLDIFELKIFETVTVPFTIRNIRRKHKNILFRVAIEDDRNYYVNELISVCAQKVLVRK